MMQVIEDAKELDRRLEEWCSGLSDVWAGDVSKVVTEEPKDVMNAFFWPGPQFIYQDLNIAHLITDYRMCRMFCHTVVREVIGALPASSHTDSLQRIFTEAVYISQQMANDICSTLPYFLGFGMEYRLDCTTAADRNCKSQNHLRVYDRLANRSLAALATGAYFAAPCIFVTKNISCIGERQRQWLLGRLLYLGKRHGHVEESPPVKPPMPSKPIAGSITSLPHQLCPALQPAVAPPSLESYG